MGYPHSANFERGRRGIPPPNPPPASVRAPHFAPPHCPNTWRAEPRKKNTLSFFKSNFTPAKSEIQGVFFLSGFPPSPRGGGGAILGAYDLGQSHHALRAWHINRGSAGNESELFGIMTTKSVDGYITILFNGCLVICDLK